MRWLSDNDNRIKEEKAIDAEQYRAYKAAGNRAGEKLRGDGGLLVHDMFNEAIIDSEKKVPWYRR